MIQTTHADVGALAANPMVIHRIDRFLGMMALSNRSEVSFLSRGVRNKRRLH